jgi:hypothetical protein
MGLQAIEALMPQQFSAAARQRNPDQRSASDAADDLDR